MGNNNKNNKEIVPVNSEEEITKEDEQKKESEVALTELPPELVAIREQFISSISSSSSSFSNLLDKFEPQHVTKFLDNWSIDNDHDYQLKKGNRIFHLIYFLIILAFSIFLIIYLLPENADLLMNLIQIVVILGGGIGIGGRFLTKKTPD